MKMTKNNFEIGEIVGMKHFGKTQQKAVVLGIENNNLFDSVQCVKIMIIGGDKPTFTLSDRICKI